MARAGEASSNFSPALPRARGRARTDRVLSPLDLLMGSGPRRARRWPLYRTTAHVSGSSYLTSAQGDLVKCISQVAKTLDRPGHETEQALLDAAERLLIEVGTAGITTRRVAEGPERTTASSTTTSVRWRSCSCGARALHRAAHRSPAAMYSADTPFLEKWRTAMGFLDEDRPYPKIWFELQAMAWNRPEIASGSPGARRVARRSDRGVRAGPRGSSGSTGRSRRWSRSWSRSTKGSCSSGSRGSRPGTASCSLDRRLARAENAMTVASSRRAHEQTRARYPTRRDTSSATASASSTRCTARASRRCFSCRRGRSSTRALEGAGAVPRAPLPRRHVRRPRQRPVGPPTEPDAYGEEEFAADALAVLDATGVERAVLVSLSRGAERSLPRRRATPSGSTGCVFIAPGLPLPPDTPRLKAIRLRRAARRVRRLGQVQPPLLGRALRGLPRVLLLAVFTEPHSTKQIEDSVGWGLETTPRR